MNHEFARGYLAGFRDGQMAAQRAISAVIDTLEQKYLAIQYAADAQDDDLSYTAECSTYGQPEDMG